MDHFKLSAEIAGEFARFPERIAICDESGFTLGYFEPLTKNGSAEAQFRAQFREKFPVEELVRRMQQSGGRSTEEVFERLRNL